MRAQKHKYLTYWGGDWKKCKAGLKVNDQLVAYATRFFAVRLKNLVWSHHCDLKAKVQCNFSSGYLPYHTNILRLVNITKFKHRHNTTGYQ